MTIELVLALLVNLLHTRAPDAPPPAVGTTTVVLADMTTLRDLLVGLTPLQSCPPLLRPPLIISGCGAWSTSYVR